MSRKKVADKLFTTNRIHQVVLLLVPFLLYIQTTSFDFSYHDDDIILLNNYQTLHDFSLEKIFLTDAWLLKQKIELYRPFQSFTFALDNRLGDRDASVYHFHNVLIFCVSIQLLYLFLLTLRLGGLTSFFLSLIFSVHFLFAHTVSWIPARGDLYLFAFSMGSFLCYYVHLKKNQWLFLTLAALCYFGALLSKESGIVLLPLLYLTGVLFWNVNLRDLKSYALAGLGFLLTGLYLWMRSQSVLEGANIFTWKGFVYNLPVIPEEIFKFFIPAKFSVMPAFHPLSTWVGIGLVTLIAAAIIYFRRNLDQRLIIIGIAFFLLPILPSVIYKPAFTGFAYDYLDHRMFFPGIGLLLIGYALITPLIEKKNLSVKYVYGLVAVMFVVAFFNARNYKNYTSYYDNATRTNPKSGLAWMNYGTMLARANDYPKMFDKFNTALKVIPDNIELRMKLADSYFTIKDYPKMLEQCNAVIALDSTFAKAYFDIGLYLLENKLNDSAIATMNTCIRRNDKNAEAYYYRGMLYKQIKMNDSALVDFTRTTQLNPQYANAYFEQGHLYGNTGKYNEALTAFNQYVNLNPNDGRAYFYRGQALCLLNNIRDGCRDLHTALNLGVTDAKAKIDYFCK